MKTIELGSVVRRLPLVAILALVVFAGPVLAQQADWPNVKVGDQWLFAVSEGFAGAKRDLAWVVTSVTPAGIEGTENGQPMVLTPDLNVLETTQRKDSDLRLLSFPLEIGKQWSFKDDYVLKDTGVKGRVNLSVEVVGYEKVRVTAGEFDAFKIEAKGSYSGMSYGGPSGTKQQTLSHEHPQQGFPQHPGGSERGARLVYLRRFCPSSDRHR